MKAEGVVAAWLVLWAGGGWAPLLAAQAQARAPVRMPQPGPAVKVQQAPTGNSALAAGPFVRMVRHNDGSKSITARDESTKELVITTYDPEGNLRLRRNYQLDLYGKPVTFLFYDGSGRPLVRGEYVYDALDRVAEEKWYELPSQRPIRRLAQTYDAKGKQRLAPQTMHEATLPPEVVRWLEPDKSSAQEAAARKPAEKGWLSRLGKKTDKDKEKKEQARTSPAAPAAAATGSDAASPPPATGSGGKGPLHGIFNRTKK